MLDLKSLENEIKFFEYLDGAVYAYKLMSEEKVKNFCDGIRRGKRSPIINSTYDSNINLSMNVLAMSLTRKLFMFMLRERKDIVDFSKVENDERYITLKNKLFKNDPSLTNAECNKIFTKIGNSIAHGDVITSFNFDEYEKLFNDQHSLISNVSQADNYQRMLNSTSFKFNYESIFQFDKNGQRVKRPSPLKIEMTLTLNDLDTIMTLMNFEFVKQEAKGPVCFYVSPNLDEGGIKDINTGEYLPFALDDVQKEALQALTLEMYVAMMKQQKRSDFFRLNTAYASQLHLALPVVALNQVIFEDKYKYLKIRDMFDNIRPTICLKQNEADVINYSFMQTLKEKGNTIVDTARACFRCQFTRAYKEYLITQVANLIEEIEQNNLKTKVCAKASIISEIAAAVFEKSTDSLTDKEKRKVLEHFRNAFVHCTYINGAEDKIEIYDHKSKTDSTPEHKFTAYTSDLEEIKDACIETFKELRNEMKNARTENQPEKEKKLKADIDKQVSL